MVIFKRAYTTCNFHLHQCRRWNTNNVRLLLHAVNQFVKEKNLYNKDMTWIPGACSRIKRIFKYVWMQMKLFTVSYQVINCRFNRCKNRRSWELYWVWLPTPTMGHSVPTQNEHPLPQRNWAKQGQRDQQCTGLTQGIRAQPTSADTALSPCF